MRYWTPVWVGMFTVVTVNSHINNVSYGTVIILYLITSFIIIVNVLIVLSDIILLLPVKFILVSPVMWSQYGIASVDYRTELP